MEESLRTGMRIGHRYVLRELRGQGSFGEVWRSWDLELEHEVALKLVRQELRGTSEELWRRLFYEEAQVLAALHHPYLVRAYDFGVLPGYAAYLVMEYVEGVSLAQVWSRGLRLDWPLFAQVVEQLTRGLGHMHARGIIHLDLKPENVMLSCDERGRLQTVIVDLGSALIQEGPGLESFRLASQGAEREDAKMSWGTLPYAAPEQLDPGYRFQGPATDLHALGVLMYQFCCGRLPYWEGDVHALGFLRGVAQRMLHGARASFEPLDGVPDEVEGVVDKLLARSPWDRYLFAGQVRRALAPLWSVSAGQQAWESFWSAWQPGEAPQGAVRGGGISGTVELDESPDALASRAGQAQEFVEEAVAHGSKVVGFSRLLGEAGRGKGQEVQRKPSELLPFLVPSFYGRQEERKLLRGAVRAVCRNKRRNKRLLLVSGEPGIGKSRLGQWLMEYVHERGELVGLRVSFGRRPVAMCGMYAAFEQLFSFAALQRAQIQEVLLRWWGSSQAELAEGLAMLLRPVQGEEEPLNLPLAQQLEALDARVSLLVSVLREVCQGEPLLLWADQLMYADRESLHVFSRLLEGELPVLLFATLGAAPSEGQELEAWLDAQKQKVDWQELVLQPLTQEALGELVGDLLRLEPSTFQALYQGRAGNPLLTLQQLHDWGQAGELHWEPEGQCFGATAEALERVDEDMWSLWQGRLERLPCEARLAALAASTLGSVFSVRLFRALMVALGLPADEVLLVLVQQLLFSLRGEHISWTSSLLEEHLVAQLGSSSHNPAYYLAAVEVLQHAPVRTRGVVRLEVQNLLLAGEQERACQVLFSYLAASWRQRRDAVATEQDLALIEAHVVPAFQADWWFWSAEVATFLNHFEKAQKAAEKALRGYEERGDLGGISHTQRLNGQLARALSRYEDAQRWFIRSIASAEESGDKESELNSRLDVLQLYFYQGRNREAEQYIRQTLIGEAAELPFQGPLARYCLLLGFILQSMGRLDESIRWTMRALQLLEQYKADNEQGRAHFVLSWNALYQDRVDDARRHCSRAIELFVQSRSPWWEGSGLILHGWIACWLKEGEQAQESAQKARACFAQLPHEQAQTLLLQSAALLIAEDNPQAAASLDEIKALDFSRTPHAKAHTRLVQIQDAMHKQAYEQASVWLDEISRSDEMEPMLLQPLLLMYALCARKHKREEEACLWLDAGCTIWQTRQLSSWSTPWLLRQLHHFSWPKALQTLLNTWLPPDSLPHPHSQRAS